jgi:hypothetical protein
MTNYLCSVNGEVYHFFYNDSSGICRRKYLANNFRNTESIYPEGLDGFCVHVDSGGSIHILCTNSSHEIVYLLYKNGSWHKCVITKNRADVTPLFFKIGIAQGRIQLFCSARHQNNLILIHSVLGINAMPAVIDSLKDSRFTIHGTRIYYSNSDGVLGYQDFSDGKPNQFIPIRENSAQPYVCDRGITYISEESVMFGDKNVYSDPYASAPVLITAEDKLMLMWQSGGFVRYMTSSDDGASWSGPMRFVSANREVQLYNLLIDCSLSCCYGSHTDRDINMFGISEWSRPASKHAEKHLPAASNDDIELQKLKIMLEMMKTEVVQLKKQMKELHSLLNDNTN